MSAGSPVGISDEMLSKKVKRGKQEDIQNSEVSIGCSSQSRLGKSSSVQRLLFRMTPNTSRAGK